MIKKIEGQYTSLVEISVSDSPDICRLRNNPANNRFLSSSEIITIEDQREWVSKNSAQNDNIYFKIIESKTDLVIGTISIYNIKNKEGEFGRYICEKTIQAIESEYLILKFGFDQMKLNRIYCHTLKGNRQVWRQHYKFGFKDMQSELLNEDVLHVSQEILKNDFKQFEYKPILSLLNKFNKKFI